MVRILTFYVDVVYGKGRISDMHFNEASAHEIMNKIKYTDRLGAECAGAHWSEEYIREKTNMLSFPDGTTQQDKYVAFNLFYADTCKSLDDMAIIRTAYNFFFKDEDYGQEVPKLWQYAKAILGY